MTCAASAAAWTPSWTASWLRTTGRPGGTSIGALSSSSSVDDWVAATSTSRREFQTNHPHWRTSIRTRTPTTASSVEVSPVLGPAGVVLSSGGLATGRRGGFGDAGGVVAARSGVEVSAGVSSLPAIFRGRGVVVRDGRRGVGRLIFAVPDRLFGGAKRGRRTEWGDSCCGHLTYWRSLVSHWPPTRSTSSWRR